MSKREIDISDISSNLLDEIISDLSSYSVSMLGLSRDNDNEHARFLGSGSLIEIEDIRAILTADHVMDEVAKYDYIGLALSSQVHRYVIERSTLKLITIDRGQSSSTGPDLAVIVLPSTAIGQIRAIKSFFNLTWWREELASAPLGPHEGLWFVCGVPYKSISSEGPGKGHIDIQNLEGICGTAPLQATHEDGKHDYIELRTSYDEIEQPIRDFRGVSGGGLWQVEIIISDSNEVRAGRKVLSGVVFYQEVINEHLLDLRGHGRRSIYDVTYNIVTKTLIGQ